MTLNRPEVHNAFNFTMMQEIHSCWRSLRDNDDVRVIVLTGAGDKAFCTGIDRTEQVGNKGHVNDVGQRGATPFHHDEPDDYLPPKTAADLWKPVIAAVGYRQALDIGKTLVMLGTDQDVLSQNQQVFQSGTRQTWRTR